MNDATPNTDRVLELAEAVCGKTISKEDSRELQSLLLADPAACRRYLFFCQMHTALRFEVRADQAAQRICQPINIKSIVQASPESDYVETPLAPNVAPPVLPMMTEPTFGYLASGWPMAYLVATVLMSLGLLISAHTYIAPPASIVTTHQSPATIEDQTPSDEKAIIAVVGRITGMVGCAWRDSATVPSQNALVSHGDCFTLTSGLLEITYNTGAKVLLQGPVNYQVDSKNGGFLAVGRLTGKVTTEVARGLTIETPTATVTDLGTEFGVEVQPDHRQTVVVFQGRVRVATHTKQDKAVKDACTLTAGQAMQLQGEAITSLTATASADETKRFIRTLRPGEDLPTAVKAHANLILWLKADAIEGVKNGETIGFWNDSSGNRNNFYHISAVPTYIGGEHSDLNHMPVVRFQGNECFRGLLDSDVQKPGVQSLNAPFTILAVVKNADRGNAPVNRAFFGGGSGKMAFGMGRVRFAPANSFWAWAPNEMSTYGKPNSLDTKWNIHAFTVADFNPHHWAWHRNGVATGGPVLDTGKPQPYDDVVYLGCSASEYGEFWQGDIAELMLYDRVLNAADLKKIQTYLAGKYRILIPEAVKPSSK
jgi:hypothetical protein